MASSERSPWPEPHATLALDRACRPPDVVGILPPPSPMPPERFLEAEPRSPSTGTTATPGRRTLPSDILEESSRRLRIACIVWAGLWSAGIAVNTLIAPRLGLAVGAVVPWPPIANVIAPVCILVSLGVYFYALRRRESHDRLVTLGLGYEVVLALGIGLVNQSNPEIQLAGRLSWICVLVLVHPMIVPSTPGRTLVAATIAASMDPLALGLAGLRGAALPPVALVAWAYAPNYLCALLAVLQSHIIMGLGRKVRRAREMGSYELEDLVSVGGMGEVWRARHRLLARPAAVKLIRPEMLGSTGEKDLLVQRFRREAEAAASLHSPHTIDLFDFGLTRDGTFYYVMELLDGIDLEQLVRRFGPLPPGRVVHLLSQACHSLSEAHAAGLVHRDVKPSNLFCCRLGEEVDWVKVLDFGLVKRVPRAGLALDAAEGSHLTRPDAATGTPAYMAPEAILGETVDARADLYALGCVAYWLLTGRLVFEFSGPLQAMARHLTGDPSPPSQASELAIPQPLDDLVLACLAKDPARRPTSASAVAERLASAGAEPWSAEQARRWWAAHLPRSP